MTPSFRRERGFSLIEVLVAVIVLSFGLLALAALQGSLFKSSAESKAQSVALDLAQEKLEYFRGYQTTAEFQSFADSTAAEVQTVAGTQFSRTWTVDRYAYPTAGGTFALVADTGATASGYTTNNEFKRVQVNVAWKDAEGKDRTVTLEDAIASLSPADSSKLSKYSNSGAIRGPRVMIKDPTTEGGVIPIAIGDDTDTAATNPKPITAGNNNNQRVIETRFDIYTYTGANGSTAQATSRIETALAGCTCSYANKDSTATAKRPTYWNGVRYVVPENASYTPLAGEATLNNNEAQSELCTACCRDHHDPQGVAGAKFDPRNANHSQGHYLLDSSTGATGSLVAPSSGGTYTESCRLIRVDGYFRVAADMYDDYSNLLETKNDGSATAYLPTAAGTTNYQNFVLSYLTSRVVTPTTNYNSVLAATSPPTVATLESQYSINNPASITIAASGATANSSGSKWLHSRGLYVDYLEDEAVQAINDAKTNCQGASGTPTASELRTCVLKVLPFTSINLTELADYASSATAQINVTTNQFKTSTDSQPVRGNVIDGSATSNNATANAVATIRRSNSGLTTQPGAIDPDDAANWPDSQAFQISGGSGGGSGSGYNFTLTFSNYPFGSTTASYPTTSLTNGNCGYATTGSSKPNPYACSTSTLSGAQLTIGHYNTQVSVKKSTLNCTGMTSGSTHTFGGQGATINQCHNYAITSPTGGLVSNDGKIAESTVFSITSASPLTLTFTDGTPTDSYTCVYNGGNGSNPQNNDNNYTVTPVNCP